MEMPISGRSVNLASVSFCLGICVEKEECVTKMPLIKEVDMCVLLQHILCEQDLFLCVFLKISDAHYKAPKRPTC